LADFLRSLAQQGGAFDQQARHMRECRAGEWLNQQRIKPRGLGPLVQIRRGVTRQGEHRNRLGRGVGLELLREGESVRGWAVDAGDDQIGACSTGHRKRLSVPSRTDHAGVVCFERRLHQSVRRQIVSDDDEAVA
jgi:hypothetical protein